MPRLKKREPSAAEFVRAEINGLLTQVQTINNWTKEELASKLGLSAPTLLRRRKSIYTWQVSELKALAIISRKSFSEILDIFNLI